MKQTKVNKTKKILSVKFGWKCWYCGDDLSYRERHLDHIVPKSKGGGDELTNLALTCGPCNRAKLAGPLEEHIAWLARIRNNEIKPLIRLDDPHPLSSIWQQPEI